MNNNKRNFISNNNNNNFHIDLNEDSNLSDFDYKFDDKNYYTKFNDNNKNNNKNNNQNIIIKVINY